MDEYFCIQFFLPFPSTDIKKDPAKPYPPKIILSSFKYKRCVDNSLSLKQDVQINSPKLFNSDEEISEMDISKDIKEDDLFEKDFVNDEEFEIPAFLRKQKY